MRCVKLFPTTIYDIASTENWLAAQAEKGWAFTTCVWGLPRFRREEPAEVRYRLDPMPQNEMRPEQARLDACSAAGWTYVDSLGDAFHIYRCESAAPFPPDPAMEPVARSHLKRKLYRSGHQALVFFLAVPLVALLQNFRRGEELYPEIFLLYAAYMLLCCCFALPLLRRWLEARPLREALRRGAPLPHGTGGGFRRRRFWLAGSLVFLALGLHLTGQIFGFNFSISHERPALPEAPPFLTLEELKGVSVNHPIVDHSRLLFLEDKLVLRQDSGVLTAYVRREDYFLDSWANRAWETSLEDLGANAEPVETEDFDQALYQNGNYQRLLVRRGNTLVLWEYQLEGGAQGGNPDLRALLPELTERLDAYEAG